MRPGGDNGGGQVGTSVSVNSSGVRESEGGGDSNEGDRKRLRVGGQGVDCASCGSRGDKIWG